MLLGREVEGKWSLVGMAASYFLRVAGTFKERWGKINIKRSLYKGSVTEIDTK